MTIGPSFVFIHVPRTAGTTMARKFLPQFGGELVGKDHERIVPGEHQRKFTFTVVRNPYDRMLSCWYHLRRNDQTRGIRDIGFPGFMELVMDHWDEGGYSQSAFLAEARIDFLARYEAIAEQVLLLPFNTTGILWPSERMNSERRPRWESDIGDHPRWARIIEAHSGPDFLRFGYKKLS